MKRLLPLLAATFLITSVEAQIPIGSWRTHLSYSNITKILDTPDAVYGISTKDFTTGENGKFTKDNGALFIYSKDEESIETLNKTTKINESLCSEMAYSPVHNAVLLAYQNSNIDLLINGKVYNIPELKLKEIAESKRINGISFHGEIAYLATDFGFVSINIKKREFVDMLTFNTGGGCNSLIENNNYLYAFYNKGVWRCSLSQNIMDNTKWENMNRSIKYTIAHNIDGKICALSSTGIDLYDSQNDNWTTIHNWAGINSFSKNKEGYLISDNLNVKYFNNNHILQYNISVPEGTITSSSGVDSDKVFVAQTIKGISCYQIGKNNTSELLYENIKPNGPSQNGAFRMKSSNEKILAVPGGWFQSTYQIKGEFYVFENEEWTTINTSKSVPSLNLSGAGKMNFCDIIEDPNQKNRYYVASWQDGLYEFIGDSVVNLWKKENSNQFINDLSVWENSYHLMGLTSHNKRIWFVNYLTDAGSIKTFKEINDGISLFPNYSLEWIDALIITQSGNIWANNLYTGEIHIMSTKGTLENTKDDITYKINKTFIDQDNNFVAVTKVYTMVMDRKNTIWLGHDKGVLIISNPDANLNDIIAGTTTLRSSRIKVPRNDGTNNADYLLDGSDVLSIAVDGANRKWIGSANNGVYLVSETGTEIIANFTKNNSPLLGNRIETIAITPNTGEVFFSTENGICSFRANATSAQKNYKQVEVFPNPVRPDYTGLISINGLRENSTVRITDLNGNSVNEGRSLGGLYTWNGMNYRNNKVASGVYLVYASSSDGQDGVVAKILIIK